MPEVSLLATLVATVLSFVLGALWYGPLFGRLWIAASGVDAARVARGMNPVAIYGATFALGLIAAFVFGWFIGPQPGRAFAITTGAAAGICWVATSLGTSYLFEGRPASLILINGGYHAVRFVLFGVAFALLG